MGTTVCVCVNVKACGWMKKRTPKKINFCACAHTQNTQIVLEVELLGEKEKKEFREIEREKANKNKIKLEFICSR